MEKINKLVARVTKGKGGGMKNVFKRGKRRREMNRHLDTNTPLDF